MGHVTGGVGGGGQSDSDDIGIIECGSGDQSPKSGDQSPFEELEHRTLESHNIQGQSSFQVAELTTIDEVNRPHPSSDEEGEQSEMSHRPYPRRGDEQLISLLQAIESFDRY